MGDGGDGDGDGEREKERFVLGNTRGSGSGGKSLRSFGEDYTSWGAAGDSVSAMCHVSQLDFYTDSKNLEPVLGWLSI